MLVCAQCRAAAASAHGRRPVWVVLLWQVNLLFQENVAVMVDAQQVPASDALKHPTVVPVERSSVAHGLLPVRCALLACQTGVNMQAKRAEDVVGHTRVSCWVLSFERPLCFSHLHTDDRRTAVGGPSSS